MVVGIKLANPHSKQYKIPFSNIRIAQHTSTVANCYEKKKKNPNAYQFGYKLDVVKDDSRQYLTKNTFQR